MREPLIILTSWGGAQYLDWWTLVHLFGGIAIAYTLRLFGLPIQNALLIAGSILVGWEVYEWVDKIPEPWTNSVIDLIVGFLGIFLVYKVNLPTNPKMGVATAIFMLVIWGGLNLWGWVSWRERQAKLPTAETEQGETPTIAKIK